MIRFPIEKRAEKPNPRPNRLGAYKSFFDNAILKWNNLTIK